MAESQSQDRLQPSLLDRLTDLDRQSSSEPNRQRLFTQKQLRKAIVRDLEWLLNAGKYPARKEFDNFQFVRESVLNYGVPDLAGEAASSIDLRLLEKEIRQAIITFEPRINRHKLEIKSFLDKGAMQRNAISLEISAEVWDDPAPLHLMLKTEMDLESGQVSLLDFGA